ncbi:hypothetical protein C8J57DRAFT_1240049 [Mycena rebaudengoi]|nr:hypothetical protein C8J57DRAFT_1240049 [Mycena rebaudengoi]
MFVHNAQARWAAFESTVVVMGLRSYELNVECSGLCIQELQRQNNNRRETSWAGNIIEIGFSIVTCKGNRDNNGLVYLDARVAKKMAAMSMQMGRIKPANSTKRSFAQAIA